MNWIHLTDEITLDTIVQQSKLKPQVIFKHSTRCSISSMALNRFERSKQPDAMDFYFLDLIKYRDISNKIADTFSVYHESPQVLLIKDGECTYSESHSGIDMDELIEQAGQNA
jgi:bacillithiol system protein YtxJ